MKIRVSWKIWYDDGSTFSSEQRAWETAPDEGVLIIMEYFDDDKQLVHMGSDYYLMRDGTIMGFGIKDLHDHLKLGIQRGAIKFGRWATNEIWECVHAEAFGSPP